jgi:mono/diheme cytochrome c family protein
MSNSMPNYSAEVLSDEQAQDLYAYIKTLTDNPPEIEDISVLKNILDNANRIN